MANVKPIVLKNGLRQQIQVGDVLVDGSNNVYLNNLDLSDTFIPYYNDTSKSLQDSTSKYFSGITTLGTDLVVIDEPANHIFLGRPATDDSFVDISPSSGVDIYAGAHQFVFIGDIENHSRNTLFILDSDGDSITNQCKIFAAGDWNVYSSGARITIDNTDNLIDSIVESGIVRMGDSGADNTYINVDLTGEGKINIIALMDIVDLKSSDGFYVGGGEFIYIDSPSSNTVYRRLTLVSNGTASSGNQMYSPALYWTGKGWKTNATAASQLVDFRAYVKPIQGAANPTGEWTLESQINNSGTFTSRLRVDSDGAVYMGNMSAPIKIMPFPGQGSWIDISIIGGAAGLGSGGAGSNAWIAYSSGAGNWFTDSVAGDICYRNTGGKLLFGNSSGVSSFAIASDKISRVNQIATAGWGVPAIYAAGRFVAQTAAKATVASYTVPSAADGSFEISANILITASTAFNMTVTCAYTDEGNTARTLTMAFFKVAGSAILTTISGVGGINETVPYMGLLTHIRCKANTPITIATTGTFTSVTYNVEGIIKQIA